MDDTDDEEAFDDLQSAEERTPDTTTGDDGTADERGTGEEEEGEGDKEDGGEDIPAGDWAKKA